MQPAETIETLFGTGSDLTPLQASLRAIAVAFICLGFLRFSGRRAFGLGSPVDNVAAVLIGAVMSRAVVGASPFLSVVAAGATIVLLHRLLAWASMRSENLGKIVKARALVVYEHGRFNESNMRYCRITRHDIMAGVREAIHEDSLEHVQRILVERNGRISVIKETNVEKAVTH